MSKPDPSVALAALKKLAELEAKFAARTPAPAPTVSPTKLTLTQILAQQQRKAETQPVVVAVPSQQDLQKAYLASALGAVNWNERQHEAIYMATHGKSFCLIGAAGTGKTTTLKGCIQALQINNQIPPLRSSSKYMMREAPGIVCVSYTRRAVRQIARQLPKDLSRHAITIHKLIEFEPIFYDMVTPDGAMKKTMRFEPTKTATNPLPAEIKICIVDESSMVSVELFEQLRAALPRDCQFIFLGDLHQLPPVYGDSILAQKLTQIPVVELTEVYRQALESPIIRLATDIKDGKDIPFDGKKIKWTSPDGNSNVTINSWGKPLSKDDALDGFCGTIKNLINAGQYNEEEDVILMPHNVGVGTLELNLHIANALALQRKAVVHHVVAGFIHWYLAIGDRLLVDKQDCIIRGIERNPKYVGKIPLEPAASLDRWGAYQDEQVHHHLEDTNESIDELLDRMVDGAVEDKTNQASHVLILESLDTGFEFRVSEVGTLNSMVFSYALTVHKSQGSEWRRVFLFLHSSHHAMCSRELVYTAVTRAREDLIIICEPDRRDVPGTLTKAARSPRIKGNTLAEKLEWLKKRAEERLGNGEDDLLGNNGK